VTEQSWRPLFRVSASTVTKVLRSPAFLHARKRAAVIIESPSQLRALADRVEELEHAEAPLSAITDRVFAAVRFLRATADHLDGSAPTPSPASSPASTPGDDAGNDAGPPEHAHAGSSVAGTAARERLLVASLHYLVTPDDLVPDFRPGGYIDDVLLLAWVFGAAVNELGPYLADELDGEDPAPGPDPG
jgi:hypothetical protein